MRKAWVMDMGNARMNKHSPTPQVALCLLPETTHTQRYLKAGRMK